MYAQALVFLRFGCYVHNPDAIFTRPSGPIIKWLDAIQNEDNEWGYRYLTSAATSVVSIGVPGPLHQALNEMSCDYIYTNPPTNAIRSIIGAQKNILRLTRTNIDTFIRITKTTPAELIDVFESYLSRIEVNPMQPVARDELIAIKSLGVNWMLAARLPRMESGSFEPVYIVDEHHRIRCL